DVAVGEHHEPGPQGGHDLALEPVGEIGRVEQVECVRRKRVALLRPAQAAARQVGARQPGLGDRVAEPLEMRAHPAHLRRATHAIRAFDHDQPAGELARVEPRNPVAVRLEALHGAATPIATRSRCGLIARRSSRCCTSTGCAASITVMPYSATMRSYSSRMRLWNWR